MWIAFILWSSYWLVGKVSASVAFPIVSVFYPDYLSHLMETMLPQSGNLMALMGPNVVEVTNLFLAVHIVVATVIGYLGACLIILLFKNSEIL